MRLSRGAAMAGALSVSLLAFTAGAGAKTFGGVVPDVPTGHHSAPRARIANLPYGGGPVMHSNRTHLIFWQPSGSGLGYDPGYQAQAETFLARVAKDSHKTTNVYGLSGQYRDAAGPAAYNSSYGGAVVATDPLPASDCREPPPPPFGSGPPGWNVCLSDGLLMNEIEHVIRVDRLPGSSRDVYFLVLPNGLGTCNTTGPESCALGGGTDGSFCGYHASNPDGTVVYAVIPYNAVAGHCQSGNPRPNGSTADPALSTISHEHNEAVTDPLGNAWIDGQGNENGDLCIDQYGDVLAGSGAGAWDEVIGGGHYYLQEEWSNQTGSCQPRAASDSVSFTAPRRIPAHKPLKLAAHAHAARGSIIAYNWFFGEPTAGRKRVVTHAFSRPGTYRVVLRVTDSADNWAFATHTVKVTKALAKDRRKRRR